MKGKRTKNTNGIIRRGKKKKEESSSSDTPVEVPVELPTQVPLVPDIGDYPLNKDGFSYTLAVPDKVAISLTKTTEGPISEIIPPRNYRSYNHDAVVLSIPDRSPIISLLNQNEAIGSHGYSMVRASHGVDSGKYFFEVKIISVPEGAALRIGWAQRYASLEAPAGHDEFSYSWRSKHGTKFHMGHGKTYSPPGYGANDIIGVYIDLPPKNASVIPSLKSNPLIKFKDHIYFEERFLPFNKKDLKIANNSHIAYYKNGVYQGIAYSNIFQGKYYPAVSIYKNAHVYVNFGPIFEYPCTHARPISERCHSEFIERYLSDVLYLALEM